MTAEDRLTRLRSNILRLATGSAVSQALLFAATPVLTRLYAPEDFGAFAVFTGLHALFASIATFKFDISIIVPSDDTDARHLTIATMASAVAASAVLVFGLGVASLVLAPSPPLHLMMLSLTAVVAAGLTCAQQWAGRARSYADFARAQVIAAALNVSTAAVHGVLFGGSVWGLLLGFLAGQATAAGFMLHRRRPSSWSIDWPSVWGVMRRYRRFALVVLPSTLLATVATSAHPYVLSQLFPMGDVGYYAIANRVLLAPSALIGGAISEAFRSEFNDRLHHRLPVADFGVKVITRAALIGAAAIGSVAAISPFIFGFAFGEAYEAAGTLALVLIPAALAQFVMMPVQHIFIATGRMRLAFILQSANALVPLGLLYLCGRIEMPLSGALLVSSLASLATTLATALAARQVVHEIDHGGVTSHGPAHG